MCFPSLFEGGGFGARQRRREFVDIHYSLPQSHFIRQLPRGGSGQVFQNSNIPTNYNLQYCLELKLTNFNKKIKAQISRDLSFWCEKRELTVCCGYALHTIRLATQFLTKFGTRQPLLAKNDILYRFLRQNPLGFKFSWTKKK